MKTIDTLRLCGIFSNAGLTWDNIPDLDRLNKLGKRVHRISENQCNGFQDYRGDWDQAASDNADKAVEKIKAEITTICARNGWDVKINTDPRGWPLKVLVPIYWPKTAKKGSLIPPGQRTGEHDISALVNL